MGIRTWKKDRASERIDTWLKNLPLKDIEIKEFVRDTDLTNLPGKVAYRLDGAHDGLSPVQDAIDRAVMQVQESKRPTMTRFEPQGAIEVTTASQRWGGRN